ncbi:hypothetical protein M0P65_05990 [Candidatus Gracilibacteria bacterium]|jgi:hypothetical protein|nr:hypothetical protein [Candidatus Gracilibacteria bacterium]
MTETLGSIIDKLTTVNLKMWNAQELLYEIRRMTFEEYKKKYFENEEGAKILWSILKNSCDLNIQRNVLIDGIDEHILNLLNEDLTELNSTYLQKKHKTY